VEIESITPIIKEIYVSDLTPSNSAFATTVNGEAVFVNTRIIEAIKVQPGDKLKAYVIANYSDKRDKVPWRAIRCEVIGSMFEEARESVATPEKNMSEKILEALDIHGPLRTATLGRLLGSNSGDVGRVCQGLFSEGKIAMADVFSDPSQKRSSHRVWAVNLNDFDVDPFEDDEE
jgi:hypothetical protein